MSFIYSYISRRMKKGASKGEHISEEEAKTGIIVQVRWL